jgi:hypothetical protein
VEATVQEHCHGVAGATVRVEGKGIIGIDLVCPEGSSAKAVISHVQETLASALGLHPQERVFSITTLPVKRAGKTDREGGQAVAPRKPVLDPPVLKQQRTGKMHPGVGPQTEVIADPQLEKISGELAKLRAQFATKEALALAKYQDEVEPLVLNYLHRVAGLRIEGVEARKAFVSQHVALMDLTTFRVECKEHKKASTLGTAGKANGFRYRHVEDQGTCKTGEGDAEIVPAMRAVRWRHSR